MLTIPKHDQKKLLKKLKIDDINKTYQTLYDEFKAKNKSEEGIYSHKKIEQLRFLNFIETFIAFKREFVGRRNKKPKEFEIDFLYGYQTSLAFFNRQKAIKDIANDVKEYSYLKDKLNFLGFNGWNVVSVSSKKECKSNILFYSFDGYVYTNVILRHNEIIFNLHNKFGRYGTHEEDEEDWDNLVGRRMFNYEGGASP